MSDIRSAGAAGGAALAAPLDLPDPGLPTPAAYAAPSAALYMLFFVSGAATLVYQVLWQRQLASLFGGDATATATTLAVFFGGLSAGSWLWGTRAARFGDPLRTYALLEVGIATAALLHGLLIPLHQLLLPRILPLVVAWPLLDAIVKILLTTALLSPATILMGGTLPVLGQLLVRTRAELATTTSLLLAVNTLGATAGALAAGFWMPAALGLRASNGLAMAANLGVAALALGVRGRRPACGRTPGDAPDTAASTPRTSAATEAPIASAVHVLAACSGFAVLALEVLWTRMFALVLNNSTYSFAAILVVLLLALACGSLVAHEICRRTATSERALFGILLCSGASVGITPFVLWSASDGLGDLRTDGGFVSYVWAVVRQVALVTFLPGTICGAVLPCVVRLAQGGSGTAGATLGRIFASNTAGGIAGALAAGFVLLPTAGLWGAIRAVAILYLLLAIALGASRLGSRATLAAGGLLLLFVSVLDPSQLTTVALDASKQESLHELWHTPHGTVAVVARPKDLVIKLDGSYTLGGIRSKAYEEMQADLPLLIAGSPRSAFFLGLGTGITAGAALRHPLEHVTATELVPEVVTASRAYFGDHTGGLFDDPRARIVVGDGRHVLLAEPDRYDVIVADLFVPWHAGTGNLYTREHFATARDRLTDGGTFAQWLPLYQMSARELFVVARTMLAVFPQVTLWRGDFLPKQPIVALVGQRADARLDPQAMLAAVRALGSQPGASDEAVMALTCIFYAGNLTTNAQMFAAAATNTDDHPILEALAARTQSDVAGGHSTWLAGDDLAAVYARLTEGTPPEFDPYLSALDAEQIGFVRAGEILYRALVALDEGDKSRGRILRDEFRELVPYGTYEIFTSRLARADDR